MRLTSGLRRSARLIARSALVIAGSDQPKRLSASFTPKPFGLCLLAIFKNESHILREWVAHYLSQGVDRLHLVNNNSEDDYASALKPFLETGAVVLHDDRRRHAQVQIYNELLPTIKEEANWLIVCDLDEFIYARMGYSSIASFLLSLSDEVSTVQIPWKMFGSSGHGQQPAEGVISGFRHRADFSHAKGEWSFMQGSTLINGKYIARLANVESLEVHRCHLRRGHTISADGRSANPSAWCPVSEEILAASALHLNHYAIQSRQFFQDVKMTRGSVDTIKHEFVRDWDYFQRYDLNDKLDEELAGLASRVMAG